MSLSEKDRTHDLQACPFCGCHGLSFAWPREFRGRMAAIIECHTDNCYALLTADSPDKAVAAWNRRAEGVAALQQAGESTRRVSLGGEPEKEPVRIDLRDLGFTGYVSAEARSAIDAEARRKMAALINPYAWAFRGLWPDGHGPGPHRTERIAAAEAAARDGNELDKDSSLRAADRVIGALYASPLPQQTALVEEGVEKIIGPHEPAACGASAPSETPRSDGVKP